MRYRIALLALAVALILGCNSSNRGTAFKTTQVMNVGPLRVFCASSFTATERQAIQVAVQAQLQAFQQIIAPAIQSAYNTPFPSAPRNVFVYDVAFLNAPWALAQQGWTDVGDGNRINVVGGHCQLVPDLTRQLTHSYYFPYEIHHQGPLVGNVSIWTTVAQVQSATLGQLKVQRFCPH